MFRDYIEYLYSTLTTFKVHIVRLTIAKYKNSTEKQNNDPNILMFTDMLYCI